MSETIQIEFGCFKTPEGFSPAIVLRSEKKNLTFYCDGVFETEIQARNISRFLFNAVQNMSETKPTEMSSVEN